MTNQNSRGRRNTKSKPMSNKERVNEANYKNMPRARFRTMNKRSNKTKTQIKFLEALQRNMAAENYNRGITKLNNEITRGRTFKRRANIVLIEEERKKQNKERRNKASENYVGALNTLKPYNHNLSAGNNLSEDLSNIRLEGQQL